jgi:hypothetical protein
VFVGMQLSFDMIDRTELNCELINLVGLCES